MDWPAETRRELRESDRVLHIGGDNFQTFLHERIIGSYGSFNVVLLVFAVASFLQDKLYASGFIAFGGCGLVFTLVGVYYILGDYSLQADQLTPMVFGFMVLAQGCCCFAGICFLCYYYRREMVDDRPGFWHTEIKERQERCSCKKFLRLRCDAHTYVERQLLPEALVRKIAINIKNKRSACKV